jgi:hypothetical protein
MKTASSFSVDTSGTNQISVNPSPIAQNGALMATFESMESLGLLPKLRDSFHVKPAKNSVLKKPPNSTRKQFVAVTKPARNRNPNELEGAEKLAKIIAPLIRIMGTSGNHSTSHPKASSRACVVTLNAAEKRLVITDETVMLGLL